MTQIPQGYVLTDQEGQSIWFLGTLSIIKAWSADTAGIWSPDRNHSARC